jgi:hypothetical protein
MTVLRRAPREVYRVYGEDDFLARVADHQDIEPAAPASAERLLHRVAGTTMLLAAAGMVGGLVALTSLSSGAGTRRRIATGLLVAAGSRGAPSRRSARVSPAKVWREAAGVDASRKHGARERATSRTRVPQRAELAARVPLDRPEPRVISPDRTAPVAEEAQPRSAPIEAVTSTTSSPVATAVASQPRRSAGQPEFGFER